MISFKAFYAQQPVCNNKPKPKAKPKPETKPPWMSDSQWRSLHPSQHIWDPEPKPRRKPSFLENNPRVRGPGSEGSDLL